MTGLMFALEAVLVSCACLWAYDDTPQPDQASAASANNALICLIMAALATHPHRTAAIMFVAVPTCVLLRAVVRVADYARFHELTLTSAFQASCLYGIGFFMWLRRRRARGIAELISGADAVRYAAAWDAVVAADNEGLALVQAAFERAMSGARTRSRQQVGAASLGELFHQADLLNSPVQAKMHALFEALGVGEHQPCDVKREGRALQKLHRSYDGAAAWRRLCDLCRTSIVFDTPQQLVQGLDALASDPQVLLVRVGDEKQRLRANYDAAALSGGYRDVQLAAVLDTPETRARGVHEHLFEVQLHLCQFAALKSEGGHRAYVQCRNLRGQ